MKCAILQMEVKNVRIEIIYTLLSMKHRKSCLCSRSEITPLITLTLGHEGRIGMAALTLKENMDFDGKAAYQHVKNYLPSYARPRFIRIQVNKVSLQRFLIFLLKTSWNRNHLFYFWQDALVVTGTFKQMKMKLAEEGFNPAVIRDPLFYLEDNKGYVPMTQELFNSIAEGRLRL